MRIVSYDLETHLLAPGLICPPIVCGSTATEEPGSEEVLNYVEALDTIATLLANDDVTIAGANIAYDFGCVANEAPELLPLIFAKYEDGLVYDVQIGQALDAIAGGHLFTSPTGGPNMLNGKRMMRYSLAMTVKLTLGREDAKVNDFWRLRYAILERVPMSEWPWEAIQYPKDDARNTVDVAVVHLRGSGTITPLRNLGNHPEQVYTAFCLHLGSMSGIRTNGAKVDALEAKVNAERAAFVEHFKKVGFINGDGTSNTRAVKRAVALAYGASGECVSCEGTGKVPNAAGLKQLEAGRAVTKSNRVTCANCDGSGLDIRVAEDIPLSDGGSISTSRDTLAESGDDELAHFGDNEAKKVIETYLPFLREGIDRPIVLRPNVLVASGRTSYDGLIQLIPRSGGVRECFEARFGRVFGSTDYAAVELCTLAQVCYWVTGASVMMDTINASQDPGLLHTAFGAKMMGISTEEMVARIEAKDPTAKGFRQAAKAANFGFPGGMGAATLVLSKRKKSEGKTIGASGREYMGIRFCILLGGSKECGTEKVTRWGKKQIPPTCRHCIEVVQNQLRPAYFDAWPEMTEYFAWVSASVEQTGELRCFGPVDRVRGGLGFCDGANNGFQALAADGGKAALRAVTREAYTDHDSPLFRAELRVPMFVHDELFTEMLEEHSDLAGKRVEEIMVREMRRYTPDVCIEAKTALMRFWTKDAEPAYDESGKLIVWMPKVKK